MGLMRVRKYARNYGIYFRFQISNSRFKIQSLKLKVLASSLKAQNIKSPISILSSHVSMFKMPETSKYHCNIVLVAIGY
jgi:hypothetical protein